MERRVVLLALGVAAVVAATTLRGSRLLSINDGASLDPISTFLEENDVPDLADALTSSSSSLLATVGIAGSLDNATSNASSASTDGDRDDLANALLETNMNSTIDDDHNYDAYAIIQKTLLCDRRLGNCTRFIIMYTTNGTDDDGATVIVPP